MAFNKAFSKLEKEEIRLKLLASMLANSNGSYSKKTAGGWHSFWQDLFIRDKLIL